MRNDEHLEKEAFCGLAIPARAGEKRQGVFLE